MAAQSSPRKLKSDALAIFRAGLQSANAAEAVKRNLRITRSKLHAGKEVIELGNFDRLFVVGAGKAAAAMSSALEEVIGGDRISGGLVNVKRGHHKPAPKRIRLYECAHPVPDEQGRRGAVAMEDLLRTLTARDLLFVLVSGGESALLPAPAPPVTLSDVQKITGQLMKRGADVRAARLQSEQQQTSE